MLLSLLLTIAAFAAEPTVKDTPVKDHLKNHYKLYGFIRNYFVYDSRESKSGTSDWILISTLLSGLLHSHPVLVWM